MEKTFHKPELNTETEERLWKDAIFVWDTSAICSLYSLTPESKETFTQILAELKNRTWIPARVMVEYERHRDEMFGQIIKEHYKTPDFLSAHYTSRLDKFLNDIKSNNLYHPHIETQTIEELSELRDEAEKILQKIRIVTEKAIKQGKDNVLLDAKHDIIYDEIKSLETGSGFTFAEIMDIVKEGTIRYEHSIPPGYEDKDQKDSIDRFGDLIIWKEICRYAGERKVPIIFICNDTKEDWNAGNAKNGEFIPREELVEEFRSATTEDIWFYTLNGFISKLIGRIEHEEVKENNDQLTAVLHELEIMDLPDDCIKLICGNCGAICGYNTDDLYWDWELTSSDEREMGPELCYETTEYFECPECSSEYSLKFEMYQYPVNIVNYVDVEADGCTLVHTPDLEDFISFEESSLEPCVRCGQYSDDLNDEGFCGACMNEFDYECSRDD
ncbi:MAG: hypothetical protein K2H22_04750 [Muribaculaceae bacterium]|nr:hypothetical protein [Muribaculaceae bacterium]